MPGWLHLAFLVGFAVALAYAVGRIWPALGFPGRQEGIRRLERVNALVHRPLTGLADALATSATDPAAAALWEQYRRRLARMLGSLRIGRPQAGLVERDPMAFRALLGLALAVALIGTWDQAPERLRRALLPDLSGFAAGLPVSLTVSVTPPAYTGIAPIYLESGNAATPATAGTDAPPATAPTELRIPQGSTVLALVQGGSEAPELRLGEAATPFTPVEADTYQIKTEIKAGNRLAVAQGGREIAAWPITVIPDQPPAIAFAAPPAVGERRALRLAYKASDDYGLSSVTATIRRADGKTGPGSVAQIELPQPLPGLDLKKAEQVSYHDLTPHPWAGLPVEIRLTAKDALGQTTTTEPVQIVLPERDFRHPVARAIIEQRKRLILEPQERLAVSRALYAIGAQPQLFNDDIVAVLGLRVAQRRLVYEPGDTAVDSVQSLLWELALRIEEGELAVAERALRQLQQQLQDALANGAPDEEIDRLMDELQQAMDKFMQALAEKMQREMQQAGRQPNNRGLDPNQMQVRREDLQKMLERARELAKGGARQAAQDLLAQLQEMLENLQAQPFPGQQDPATAEAMQMLDDMDQLAQRQKDLLDRTFRRSQEQDSQPGEQGQQGQGGDPSAKEQEALRRALGEVMRRYGEMMGDIPRPLGRAERAMRDASKALEQGQPGAAVEPQGQALSELQQGMQEMANSMMQQLHQQMMGQRGNDPQQGQNRDPLGRDENGMGMFDTSDVKIPEQSDVQRAKQLIDELRRRSGDRERPQIERDYIERLLRQF